jgi:hypothetical protein
MRPQAPFLYLRSSPPWTVLSKKLITVTHLLYMWVRPPARADSAATGIFRCSSLTSKVLKPKATRSFQDALPAS